MLPCYGWLRTTTVLTQYYYCSTLKLDEKKEVQILEVGTCQSLSIEFIAETVRERGNQSTTTGSS